jgi:tRNA-2-methylthio-N6-dimethylallyladenosine synthase
LSQLIDKFAFNQIEYMAILQNNTNTYREIGRSVYIRTFGCQMNDRDSEALMGLFLKNGYSQAQDEQTADVILANTCSVREHAEDRAMSYIGGFKKLPKSQVSAKKRGAYDERASKKIIGIIGCMARNRGEEVFQRMRHIDLMCGPSCLFKIPAYIEKIKKEKTRIIDIDDTLRDEDMYRTAFRMDPEYAQVVISTGCSNYCSYCVVPYVRGNLRLRKPDFIIDEVKNNIEMGIKRITLLGQNVNDYVYVGKSGKINFVKLLKDISEIEGVEELSFITSQPKNTTKELFQLMANASNIKKHLHLPVQSGSNRILQLMKRGYTIEHYMQLVSDYKKIVKGTISTDIIVGFPTETDKDFQQTKKILEKVKFKNAYIFKYSKRMRAESRKMLDGITDEIKAQRHSNLLELQKSISGAASL